MAGSGEQWDMDADVVVVGSGGAGLTAAILAHDNGARVILVERSNMVGGTTAVSGGAGDKLKLALGPDGSGRARAGDGSQHAVARRTTDIRRLASIRG